ncbi:MAG: SRPBCC family protein [Verrucomicrobiales bacterium]|nr:SRPBCC family protein [Verrucomicrobiales bacterium]
MPIISLITKIDCPIEVAFDLSRSIDLHEASTAQTNEKAIEGRTTGLIEMGERVTWEATHFGIRQRLGSEITAFDRPRHFRDSMIFGAFERFDHDHHFAEEDGKTVMTDRFDYTSPFGLIGRFADVLFLKNYMTALLMKRNELIRNLAESDPAKFLP